MFDLTDLTDCTYKNDSAASRAAGQTSPYLRLPERESYREWAMRDGKAVAVRDVHRWAGTVSVGDWREA